MQKLGPMSLSQSRERFSRKEALWSENEAFTVALTFAHVWSFSRLYRIRKAIYTAQQIDKFYT